MFLAFFFNAQCTKNKKKVFSLILTCCPLGLKHHFCKFFAILVILEDLAFQGLTCSFDINVWQAEIIINFYEMCTWQGEDNSLKPSKFWQ